MPFKGKGSRAGISTGCEGGSGEGTWQDGVEALLLVTNAAGEGSWGMGNRGWGGIMAEGVRRWVLPGCTHGCPY